MQIQGSEGDLELRTRGNHAVQIETLQLRGASGAPVYAHHEAAGHRFQPARPLAPIEVDEQYSWIPEQLREQPFYNTAQVYARLAAEINGATPAVPDFGVALELLELIDAVKQSSANGGCRQPVRARTAALAQA